MLHTVIALSAASRSTSYSISFQPATERSTRVWLIGLARRLRSSSTANSSRVSAIPPPVPPSVYAGRLMTGNPTRSAKARPSCTVCTVRLSMTGSPMRSSNSLNACRSSAMRMLSSGVPSRATPHFCSTPALASSIARFRPVCPPSVGSRPSGRSRSMMRSSTSTVKGSTYTRSATSSSVIIVAGLELTSTTRTPSSRSARHACVPA